MSYSREELISRINDISELVEHIDEKISFLEEDKSRLYVELSDLEQQLEFLDTTTDDVYDLELW